MQSAGKTQICVTSPLSFTSLWEVLNSFVRHNSKNSKLFERTVPSVLVFYNLAKYYLNITCTYKKNVFWNLNVKYFKQKIFFCIIVKMFNLEFSFNSLYIIKSQILCTLCALHNKEDAFHLYWKHCNLYVRFFYSVPSSIQITII